MTRVLAIGVLAMATTAASLMFAAVSTAVASATPICEAAAVDVGPSVQIGPECIPYGGAVICQTTTVTDLVTVQADLCLPAPLTGSVDTQAR